MLPDPSTDIAGHVSDASEAKSAVTRLPTLMLTGAPLRRNEPSSPLQSRLAVSDLVARTVPSDLRSLTVVVPWGRQPTNTRFGCLTSM